MMEVIHDNIPMDLSPENMKESCRFYYMKENGVTVCILKAEGKLFFGEAFCADEDRDMQSELTGCSIAERRAFISYFTHCRDNVLIPTVRALKHAYACMEQSPKFNAEGYEARFLARSIQKQEEELDTIRDMIADEKRMLNEYLQNKEKVFKSIREMRAKDN